MADKRFAKAQGLYYHIWHDGQEIRIPVGQSTANDLSTETVGVNTRVYGKIIKGKFYPPYVEFTNTTNQDIFDGFYLMTRREFTGEDGSGGGGAGDGDLVDLSIFREFKVSFTLLISFNGYIWMVPQYILMERFSPNYYRSEPRYINTVNFIQAWHNEEFIIELQARYILDSPASNSYDLGTIVQTENKLYIDVGRCTIDNGSSSYIYNSVFNPDIPEIGISILNPVQLIEGII